MGKEGDVGLGVGVAGVAHAIAFETGHDSEVHVRRAGLRYARDHSGAQGNGGEGFASARPGTGSAEAVLTEDRGRAVFGMFAASDGGAREDNGAQVRGVRSGSERLAAGV